jgi:hypothetical protein
MVHRCAACDHDWPPQQAFNLCAICQRCTYVTDGEWVSRDDSLKLKAKHDRIRAFDAKCDEAAAEAHAQWAMEMNLILEMTPDIPDDGPENAQDTRWWDDLMGAA